MSERIGVVVVAYRSAPTIEACVRAVLAQPDVCGVVVVDNSPDDEAATVLAQRQVTDPRLHCIHRPENPGFARACNIGAAALPSHTHVAFVNPDVTLVRPLTELAGAERTSGFAVLAGGLAAREGEPFGNARAAAALGRELRKALAGSGTYLLRELPPNEIVPVGQLDGALLLASAETFARLGGFDERFELYYEDVDLCRTAADVGGCGLVTRLFGHHVGGVSSEQARGPAYTASRISRIRFFRKGARHRRTVDLALLLIAVAEILARSVARTPEGRAVRMRALRAQVTELLHPGTVSCLPHPAAEGSPRA